jgi:monoamine oxidase
MGSISHSPAHSAGVVALRACRWENPPLLERGFGTHESFRRLVGVATRPISSAEARETSTYWNGYMDGAVRSGQRAAKEILDEL